jgi:hypothetical protein
VADVIGGAGGNGVSWIGGVRGRRGFQQGLGSGRARVRARCEVAVEGRDSVVALGLGMDPAETVQDTVSMVLGCPHCLLEPLRHP